MENIFLYIGYVTVLISLIIGLTMIVFFIIAKLPTLWHFEIKKIISMDDEYFERWVDAAREIRKSENKNTDVINK